jgi:hypothetical protein
MASGSEGKVKGEKTKLKNNTKAKARTPKYKKWTSNSSTPFNQGKWKIQK